MENDLSVKLMFAQRDSTKCRAAKSDIGSEAFTDVNVNILKVSRDAPTV